MRFWVSDVGLSMGNAYTYANTNGPRFARTSLRSAAAKLETAVYPFKLARHASKPRQTPFQTIPVISFFDRQFFFPDFFSAGKQVWTRFLSGFGGADVFWTSPADSWGSFTPDPIIIRSIRLLEPQIRSYPPSPTPYPNPPPPNQPPHPPTPQKQTNHFSKNPYKRPKMCIKFLSICLFLGTFVRILQKVVSHIFGLLDFWIIMKTWRKYDENMTKIWWKYNENMMNI